MVENTWVSGNYIPAKKTVIGGPTFVWGFVKLDPIGSMYGIFTYIYHKLEPSELAGQLLSQVERIPYRESNVHQADGSGGCCFHALRILTPQKWCQFEDQHGPLQKTASPNADS